ncbi:hypothetical protein CSE16_14005 [Solibacillus sp. R5-41]|uniref:DUF3021 domain-containing protein n=1 Tax=Solibacillus sp. R5-41 TaxID=2048654 RepID=UPI000C12533C|nr:DUF3021 domain-containing protein [Solibacillus sp. R5-41]ATP41075.1 hypothetical protein CSE16_14005 [Solibacillus sp. R5-41]
MKNFLFRSMIGIFFGAFLTVILTNSIVLFSDKSMLEGELYTKNSIGFMLCGWLFSVSSLYFENQNLRLIQQTVFHFVTVIILYFILAFGIGWIPFNFTSVLLAIAIFVLIYSVSWTVCYLYFKHQMKKLNEELNLL